MLGGSSYTAGGPLWDDNAELAWGPGFAAELRAASDSTSRALLGSGAAFWLHPLSVRHSVLEPGAPACRRGVSNRLAEPQGRS
jgi:hypothetical protein